MQTDIGKSIEDKSMEIIDNEIGEHGYNRSEWTVVKRVIHTTADFDFARKNKMIFHERAIINGINALKNGCKLIVDVNGVIGGLHKKNLHDFKIDVICNISNEIVKNKARQHNKTISQVAMREATDYMNGNIIAIGNAPTALLEVIKMCDEQIITPSLIIGIPVGFISASESKEQLIKNYTIPFITNVGRKGGSACAAAIINALFKLIRN
ncbi:MAG: precorrin-8X methylmutase [Nitrosopumilaceae archaeon]|nr:precorrin-8X methylmutase [Nitrosopumilaceae archaeon]